MLVNFEIRLSEEPVLRFLGYPPDRVPPDRIRRLLEDCLPEVHALTAARGAYEELPADRAHELGLSISGTSLVVALVTIGPALENRSRTCADAGEVTRALLFDAAGSAAAEAAADALEDGFHENAGFPRTTCARFSPGYGDWPLSAQRALFDLLPHEALGVALMPSLLMVPRKSVSFALWLDGHRPVPRASGCAECLLKSCFLRRGGSTPEPA
jgi:hypothetical protein